MDWIKRVANKLSKSFWPDPDPVKERHRRWAWKYRMAIHMGSSVLFYVDSPRRGSLREGQDGVDETGILHGDGSEGRASNYDALFAGGGPVRKGGVIVLSTTVTPETVPDRRGKVTGLLKTWWGRQAPAVSDQTHGPRIGFSLGNLFFGRLAAEDGTVFDDKSYSIEVVGISSKELYALAGELRRAFEQRSVLVKDHTSQEAYYENDQPEVPSFRVLLHQPWRVVSEDDEPEDPAPGAHKGGGGI